jgi:hypothetical protein
MIQRIATAINPWIYAPQPSVRIAAKITLLFTLLVLGAVSAAIGATTVYVFREPILRFMHILDRYFFEKPEVPKDLFIRIPDALTLHCLSNQFQQKHLRATDLNIAVKEPPTVEIVKTALPYGLDEDHFILICNRLHLVAYQYLACTSKCFYVACKAHFERLYNSEYFEKYLNFSISEQLFKETSAASRYALHFFLCKKFCGEPQQSHISKRLGYFGGQNFIRHLIEQIGPFTFLSIPYVKDFSLPPQHAVERTVTTTLNPRGQPRHLMRLRFRMKVNDKTVVQIIEEGWFSSSDSDGLWRRHMLLVKQEADFLISLLKQPEGARLSTVDFHLNTVTFPYSVRQRNINGNTTIDIDAVLDPPLNGGMNF